MREYGSEFPSVILPDGYFNSFNQYGVCTWTQSGREALYLLALDLKHHNDNPLILIPAYCCYSMVCPFTKAGWRVSFYRLNEDLSVDLDYLIPLLKTELPTAILTMNYFGATFTDNIISIIKSISPSIVCIEDFSHCTFSFPIIYNPQIDYYVSSIRKSVGVCDGAVIVSHANLDQTLLLRDKTEFSISRLENQIAKAEYKYSQDPFQKNIFLSELRKQEKKLDEFNEIYHISRTGKAMLDALNGEIIRYARQNNMRHLLDLTQGKVESIPGIENCLSGAPFSLPVILDDRDKLQKEFARKGLYAPVLWPIFDDARAICSVSAKMSDKMLSIPIDQRYNFDDIEDIASVLLSFF